jgi:hypothetical protein
MLGRAMILTCLVAATAEGAQHDWPFEEPRWIEGVPATLILSPPMDDVTDAGRELTALREGYLEKMYGESLEAENAWPRLMTALDMLPDAGGDRPRIDYSLLHTRDEDLQWRPPDWDGEAIRQRARAAYEQLKEQSVFQEMAELAKARRFVPPPPPGPIIQHISMSHLSAMRQATRALGAHLHFAADAGDIDEALTAWEAMLALGRVGLQSTIVIDHLVGTAITAYACGRAKADLLARELTPQQLRQMASAMDRHQPTGALTLALRGERIIALETIDHAYGEGGLSGLLDVDVTLPTGARGEELRREEQAFMQQQFEWLIKTSRKPAWEMLEIFDSTEDHVPDHLEVSSITLPAFRAIGRSHAQLQTELDGMRLMIAVERMQAATGAYPDALDALVPAYIEFLPPDPYTGETFRYRLFGEGEDPYGRGYLLYSVGLDRIDHGGRLHEGGAAMAGGRSGKGFDLVINEPR